MSVGMMSNILYGPVIAFPPATSMIWAIGKLS